MIERMRYISFITLISRGEGEEGRGGGEGCIGGKGEGEEGKGEEERERRGEERVEKMGGE